MFQQGERFIAKPPSQVDLSFRSTWMFRFSKGFVCILSVYIIAVLRYWYSEKGNHVSEEIERIKVRNIATTKCSKWLAPF
jgi:hypothetical protein